MGNPFKVSPTLFLNDELHESGFYSLDFDASKLARGVFYYSFEVDGVKMSGQLLRL